VRRLLLIVAIVALVVIGTQGIYTAHGRLGWAADAACVVKGEALHYYIAQPAGPVWLANAGLPVDGSAAARCAWASGELLSTPASCPAMAVHRLIICE
jgi:hypothetical protein